MSRSRWLAFLAEEEAVTAAEYACILALIVMAAIASVTAVGNSTSSGWQNNYTAVNKACTGS